MAFYLYALSQPYRAIVKRQEGDGYIITQILLAAELFFFYEYFLLTFDVV